MKNKSLGLNAIFNGMQNMLNLLFPLITFPYISRVLSVQGVGKYNFANSINSYFLLIASLGISTFAVREGSKLRDNRQEISEFTSKIFTFNLLSMVVSYILLFAFLILTPNISKYISAILIFSIQIFFTTLGMDWVYIIFEEYGYITTRNIIFKLLSIVLLFIFVRKSGDYLNYVAITVFASSGSYILNYIHVKRFCDVRINFNINWKEYVLPILIIFASNVAIQLYVNSDTVMLGFMKNDYVVGIYSAAAKINNIVNTTLIAAITVSIPRLSMLMGTGKLREYYRLLKQVISIIFIIYLPAVLGLFMESKDIIQIISGSNYLRAVTSLRILCFLLIFSAISSTIIQCILIPTKQEIKSLNCTMLGAIINIGLNFVLIPLLSEKGAAVTSVIADFVTFILSFYYGRNILINVFRDKQVKKNITQAAVASSCIVLICLICHSYVANVPLRLLLSATCSIFAYLSILALLKNNMINEVISQIES